MVKKQIIAQPKRTYQKHKTEYKIAVEHKLKANNSILSGISYSIYVEVRVKKQMNFFRSALKISSESSAVLEKLMKDRHFKKILDCEQRHIYNSIKNYFDKFDNNNGTVDNEPLLKNWLAEWNNGTSADKIIDEYGKNYIKKLLPKNDVVHKGIEGLLDGIESCISFAKVMLGLQHSEYGKFNDAIAKVTGVFLFTHTFNNIHLGLPLIGATNLPMIVEIYRYTHSWLKTDISSSKIDEVFKDLRKYV